MLISIKKIYHLIWGAYLFIHKYDGDDNDNDNEKQCKSPMYLWIQVQVISCLKRKLKQNVAICFELLIISLNKILIMKLDFSKMKNIYI